MVFPQQKTSKISIVLVLVCFLIVSTSAEIIKIRVGGKPKPNHPLKLKFEPQNITAVKGDIIKWEFKGGNHDVVQSEGLASCGAGSKKVDGFASETNPPEKQFNITIQNDQDIIYYMCMVGDHCVSGMWGAIYVGGTEPFPITNPKPKPKKPHGHHFKPGEIAGITIGGVGVLGLFSALGFFGFRRYKSRQSLKKTTPEHAQFVKTESYSGSTDILKTSTKVDNV